MHLVCIRSIATVYTNKKIFQFQNQYLRITACTSQNEHRHDHLQSLKGSYFTNISLNASRLDISTDFSTHFLLTLASERCMIYFDRGRKLDTS